MVVDVIVVVDVVFDGDVYLDVDGSGVDDGQTIFESIATTPSSRWMPRS